MGLLDSSYKLRAVHVIVMVYSILKSSILSLFVLFINLCFVYKLATLHHCRTKLLCKQ